MKIYIASSWKNQHGIEMLTALLRERGHKVVSWIENCNKEGSEGFRFEEWIKTEEAQKSFEFDTHGATQSHLLIYYGPAGKDACAELGAAWGAGVKCIGLYAKGEDLGLMRKMCDIWCDRIPYLLDTVQAIQRQGEILDQLTPLNPLKPPSTIMNPDYHRCSCPLKRFEEGCYTDERCEHEDNISMPNLDARKACDTVAHSGDLPVSEGKAPLPTKPNLHPQNKQPYTGQESTIHMTIMQEVSARFMQGIAQVYKRPQPEEAARWACDHAERMLAEWRRRGWA